MPDTSRTLAQILTLLADNTIGDISAQDLRDAVVSLTPKYGGAHLTGNTTATAIAGASTPVVTNWNAAAVAGAVSEFTASTGGRLTYTGTPTISVNVRASVSAYAAVAAVKKLRFEIRKNGTLVPGGKVEVDTPGDSTTNTVNVSLLATTTLATSDYIEIYVSNETDAEDVILAEANLLTQSRLA